MEKNKAVIVIPIYQAKLSYFEDASLRRCLSILKDYPIVVIAPEDLDTTFLSKTYGIDHVERFDNLFFKGLDGYNRLMLSPEFYKRFLNYTYMLIYQLDAYVFYDNLAEWCDKGYDYIGAPWIPSPKYKKIHHRLGLKATQTIYRLLSSYGSRSNYYHTGNGGFSLRKISTFYNITLSDKQQIHKFLNKGSYHYAEDIYWGIRANHLKKRLNIPHYSEAIAFAFENRPEMLYKDNNLQLPFGAHAWYKNTRALFWKQFIPEIDHSVLLD